MIEKNSEKIKKNNVVKGFIWEQKAVFFPLSKITVEVIDWRFFFTPLFCFLCVFSFQTMNNYDNEDVLERIRSALRSSTNREERKKLEEAVCFNPFSFQHFQ